MTGKFEYFQDHSGTLAIGQTSLSVLAEKYGTPLYVYSAEGFRSPLRRLREGLKGLDYIVCFAMKANSNLAILKLLAKEGAGMDLVSGFELQRALDAGCPEGKIVFSGVGKTRNEIEFALDHDIHSFNVESIPELRLINEVARAKGKVARVALRFNPDVDPKTHPYISTGLKKNKFGLDRVELMLALLDLKKHPNIELKGLSIHIGSQILSLKPFEDAFRKLIKLVPAVEKSIGQKLEFLDLGGGLGVQYKNEKPPRIEAYCRLVQKYFGSKSANSGYRILLEPGRQLAANSGVLLTRVLFRKNRAKKDFLIVDAAMNDLMRPSLYGSYHDIVAVEKARRKGRLSKTDIVGPVCESSDCFASDRAMSKSIRDGDLLAILSAGAYGMSMASQYNSRPRAAEVLVEERGHRLIRRRETYEDIVRSEIL